MGETICANCGRAVDASHTATGQFAPAVTVGGRMVEFCGLGCTIAFLEDLFERWAQAVGQMRLN